MLHARSDTVMLRRAQASCFRQAQLFALTMASALIGATVAHADAIDGQWCLGTSHFEINGPRIRTPSGTDATGSYHRHGFKYVVPTNEPEAGTEITMVLLNEDTVQLQRGSSSPEIWLRCKPIS